MALPVLVKTWQFDVNQAFLNSGVVLTDNQNLLFAIKQSFIGFALFPWTVNYSCDSVTAGVPGDGIDRWLAPGNLIWGGTFSWIVLQQAGLLNGQYLIACNSFTSQNISLYFSLAGFVGGLTNARPTAPDELQLRNSSGWLNGSGVSQDQVAHVQQSTDGQCTRVALCSGGNQMGGWILDRAQSPVVGWATPVVVSVLNAGAGSDSWTYGNMWSAVPFGTYFGGAAYGLYGTCESYSGSAVGQQQTSANDVDNAWPMAPLGLASNTVGFRGRQGQTFDIWYGSTALITGDTYPAGVSRQFTQFGDVIIPWNGSIVQVS